MIGTDPITFSLFLQSGITNLAGDSGIETGTTVTIAGGILHSASGSTLTVNVANTTQYAVQVLYQEL